MGIDIKPSWCTFNSAFLVCETLIDSVFYIMQAICNELLCFVGLKLDKH